MNYTSLTPLPTLKIVQSCANGAAVAAVPDDDIALMIELEHEKLLSDSRLFSSFFVLLASFSQQLTSFRMLIVLIDMRASLLNFIKFT